MIRSDLLRFHLSPWLKFVWTWTMHKPTQYSPLPDHTNCDLPSLSPIYCKICLHVWLFPHTEEASAKYPHPPVPRGIWRAWWDLTWLSAQQVRECRAARAWKTPPTHPHSQPASRQPAGQPACKWTVCPHPFRQEVEKHKSHCIKAEVQLFSQRQWDW